MKVLGIVALSAGILGGLMVVALFTTDIGSTVHAWSHKAGLCAGHGCLVPEIDPSALDRYSEDEMAVISRMADQIIRRGSIEFTDEDITAIEEATDLDLDILGEQGLTETRIQIGVLAELQRRRFDIGSILGAGNCARFSACSIERDLSGASGEELARYERERGEDGRSFRDVHAPDFSLPSTTGETVSLSDYRGRPVVLAFLAGHCNHCLETLPVLDDLQSEYARQDLAVLPVYVNSGSVEDVKTWSGSARIDVPLLVSEQDSDDKALSEGYAFRMVPSLFLIDAKGLIVRKLVGQKPGSELRQAVSDLLAS